MFTEERNSEFDITTGLRTDVLKMIVNAIRNNSIESFYAIDGFVVKVLFQTSINRTIKNILKSRFFITPFHIIKTVITLVLIKCMMSAQKELQCE